MKGVHGRRDLVGKIAHGHATCRSTDRRYTKAQEQVRELNPGRLGTPINPPPRHRVPWGWGALAGGM